MKKESIDEMRKYVSNAYSGMKWHERVLNMPDRQVAAIYRNLKASKKYGSEYHIEDRYNSPIDHRKEGEWHQMDMFEYLMEVKKK